MKLLSLRLTNFRQHVSTVIEFESGITGIIGPNGSGKTSILEAIGFALYSEARTTREQMVSLHPIGRGVMKIELEFELGAHRYRVTRGRASAELYLDGDLVPIASGAGPVTERLQRIMGMSKDEFFKTYFTSQKELAAMASMASPDRGRFLSKVLGYEKLRTAQDYVSARRSALNAEINGLRAAMTDPTVVARTIADATDRLMNAQSALRSAEHRHTIFQGTFSMIAPKWERVQRDREKAVGLSLEISGHEREAAGIQKNLERVSAELATLADSRTELGGLQTMLERLPELRDENTVLEELYRQEGRRKTLAENETELVQEIEKLTAKQATIEQAATEEKQVAGDLESKRKELEEAQQTLEARRTSWVRDRQDAETKLNDLRRQYKEVKEQKERVKGLGPDAPCPTCSRQLGDSLHTVLEHLDELSEQLNLDGLYFKTRLEQLAESPPEIRALEDRRRALNNEVAALERRHTRLQVTLQERGSVKRDLNAKKQRVQQTQRDIAVLTKGFDASRFEFVRGEIGRLAPLEARAARLSALAEREPQLTDERDQNQRALEEVNSNLGTLRVRHEQMALASQDYELIRASYEKCEKQAREAELDLHTTRKDLAVAREALDNALAAGEESKQIQARVAQRESERRLHEELDRAFNEMRAQLNAELRPELSDLATQFLRELMDSRTAEFELDEKYNIVVLEDGVAKPVLSGGEEDIANLVLRLAVSQMIAERSGQAFSLLVLDEVFGSLDETRRYNVLELLRALGDRFEQVILITHIEAVRDGLDQVISVRYDPAAAASVVESSVAPRESEDLQLLQVGAA